MKTDVKHNTVYHVNWAKREYLVLFDETRLSSDHYIYIRDRTFASNAAFSANQCFLYYLSKPEKERIIREATPLEERWLRNCIAANKYVDCPNEEIINSYEIY